MSVTLMTTLFLLQSIDITRRNLMLITHLALKGRAFLSRLVYERVWRWTPGRNLPV